MNDLISRRAAIDELISEPPEMNYGFYYAEKIKALPPTQPENQVHLCDSCRYVYPECPSGKDDVIFENGKGNDNICACNKYEPSAQPEPLTDKEKRIFLAAMEREEKVCEEVDRNYVREPYEDSLVRACKEIRRKVKGALWI